MLLIEGHIFLPYASVTWSLEYSSLSGWWWVNNAGFLLEILGLNTNFICFLIFLKFTAQFMLCQSEMAGALRFVPYLIGTAQVNMEPKYNVEPGGHVLRLLTDPL